jgi:UDP-4-amino-4-deoxy-L-arabinose formyltransferase/UDP-glucuronic acid dehydrogenase (UDP-4-keto-hexauronic acid decarboxylating)
MRVAAMGRTGLLLASIRAVAGAGHEIVLVATATAAPEYSATERDFGDLAAQLGALFLESPDLTDDGVVAAIAGARADVAISVNWPTLVPPSVLEVFPHGVVNAHLGDLPRYRGNATPNWAILEGEPEVVTTLHLMDAGLDSGPILAQRRMPIDDSTYIGDVYAFSRANTPEMFVEVINEMAAGTLVATEQDIEVAGLRCHPRTPADAWIDWSRDATYLARLVRASSDPFAGAYTALGDRRLVVWRAREEELGRDLGVPGQVIDVRESGEVAVLTGSGTLVLERVSVDGGESRAPAEVISSTRTRLGTHFPTVLAELERRIAYLERQLGEASDS